MATTYLPTVRNLISDEDKRRICEAKWDREQFGRAKRTTIGYTHPSTVRQAIKACPLGLCVKAPEPIVQPHAMAYALGNESLWPEIEEFISDWDLGFIQPSDLPRILGLEG